MFDSGVGGLTVLTEVSALMPNERVAYVADQAHVPYGGRPLSEIRTLANDLADRLVALGCDAIVAACNISSATALDEIAARHPGCAVVGMIVPGAAAAATATKNGRIGVLATAGTVASEAYPRAFERMNASLTVTQVACPDFVPLIERGALDGPEAEDAVRRYLEPLLRAGVDTVVLGCTHYPFLLPVLARVAGDRMRFVDPAVHTARALASQLRRRPRSTSVGPASHLLYTTGPLATFTAQLPKFVHGIEYTAARFDDADYSCLSRSLIPETDTPSRSDILSRSPPSSS